MKNKDIIAQNNNVIEKDFDISDLREQYLDYIDVACKTVETYDVALKQFTNYLNNNNIKKPQREDIINFREYLKEEHKPTTINGYMIAVRNFFKYLEYQGIYKNITENVKGVKLENIHLKRELSREELQKVLENCEDDREKILVKITVNLGLRANEVVNIQISDFYKDGDVTMLKVLGKGRDGYKQDSIKIDDRLLQEVMNYINKYNITNYLFTSYSNRNTNNSLTTRSVRRIFDNLLKKAGIEDEKVSFHSMRHTSCVELLENGVDLGEVSEYMRHKNISTTMRYAKELNQKTSKCSNILANGLF